MMSELKSTHVIASEYELLDSAPSIFACVEDMIRHFISLKYFKGVAILNSRFLRNEKDYPFSRGPTVFLSSKEIEKSISSIEASCINKGHLSVIFAFSSSVDESVFVNYKKTAEIVNLSLKSCKSPLARDQVTSFVESVRCLKQQGMKNLYCFSHDAEFIYTICLS